MSFAMMSDTPAAVATARQPAQPADPWDAPYFGGPVFFVYAPQNGAPKEGVVSSSAASSASTPASSAQSLSAASVSAPTTTPLAFSNAPWDAPFFGAPVHFAYPRYPVSVPGFSPVVADVIQPGAPMQNGVHRALPRPSDAANAGGSTAPVRPSRRRGFFARLFHRG